MKDETVRMAGGRLFHARDAATGKARSPRVDRCTDGTTSVMVVEERRWRRPSTSAVRRTLPARYGGADPSSLVTTLSTHIQWNKLWVA